MGILHFHILSCEGLPWRPYATWIREVIVPHLLTISSMSRHADNLELGLSQMCAYFQSFTIMDSGTPILLSFSRGN